MASALARAYIGGLGAMPPVGSRGETPGQGVRGAKPPWSWREFKKRNTNFALKIATNLVKFEYCYKRRSWLKTPENEKEKTQKKTFTLNEVHANNCSLVLISEFWLSLRFEELHAYASGFSMVMYVGLLIWGEYSCFSALRYITRLIKGWTI